MRVIVPKESHRPDLASCIATVCPGERWGRLLVRVSYVFLVKELVAKRLLWAVDRSIKVGFEIIGWPKDWRKPKKSCAGEKPSWRGVFRQCNNAERKESSEEPTFFISNLTCLTADSARPFDWA